MGADADAAAPVTAAAVFADTDAEPRPVVDLGVRKSKTAKYPEERRLEEEKCLAEEAKASGEVDNVIPAYIALSEEGERYAQLQVEEHDLDQTDADLATEEEAAAAQAAQETALSYNKQGFVVRR